MRVYVVDDDPLVRRLVLRILGSEDVACEEFASAAAFLAGLPTLAMGCILLDIGMPDHNGIDVLGQIVSTRPLPVIMVSGSTDVNDAIGSFRRGAVHFVRKPFQRQVLMDTLAEAWKICLERQAADERQLEASRIRLTAREQEVLEAMMEGRQTKAIAWQLGLSVRTVEMHRSNILAKLRARNGPQAVAIARSLGLLPDRRSGSGLPVLEAAA